MSRETRSPTGAPAVDRNHWFPYKYISARDLVAEQEYLISRHRAHNRLLHGCGVVCGLHVTNHPRDECAQRWVVVGAGIAFDPWGRELIQAEARAMELPLSAGEGGKFIICMRYREERVDQVPILYADPDPGSEYSDANRIREGVELIAVADPEFDPDCWQVGKPGCIEAVPIGGDLVALAIAEVDQGGGPVKVENRARRIGLPIHNPTRVVEVSWEHGGAVTIGELRHHRLLTVRFDRRLAAAEGRARGIGEDTFTATFAKAHDALRPVPFARAPSLADDARAAVFEIAERAFREDDGSYLANATVHVTLRCDFILDREGVPVSGRHIGGRLPSGDANPGGTFESWFQVTDEAADPTGADTGPSTARTKKKNDPDQ